MALHHPSMRNMAKHAQMNEYLQNFGKNALIKAANRGDAELCRLLLSHCDVNFTDKKGGTPLMFAALCGNEPLCQLLINSKAQMNSKCQDGWTPLMYAASKVSQSQRQCIS